MFSPDRRRARRLCLSTLRRYRNESRKSACRALVIAATDIKRHLADHLERLALFAILPTADDDKTPGSGGENTDNGSVAGHPEVGSDQDSFSADHNDDLPDQSIGERDDWNPFDHNDNLVNDDDLDQTEDLAKAYLNSEQWKEAEKLYEQSVVKANVLVGAEALRTLVSEYWLAYTYKAQGRWAEAQQLHSNVLNVRVRVLGQDTQIRLRALPP